MFEQKIISFLSEQHGAVNVKTIAKYLFLSHQTTSGQLKQLLEKKIITKHSVVRESYYEIEDVLLCHWLNIKARRTQRVENYVNFLVQGRPNTFGRCLNVVQFYQSPQSNRQKCQKHPTDGLAKFIEQLDYETLQQPEYKELDRFLEYFFFAREVFQSNVRLNSKAFEE